MILMIDNYDSFTFNLVQYLWELKEEVMVYRNNRISLKEIEDLNPHHIIISPGPGTPDDAGISLNLINHFSGEIPIMGVCLGHQCIGQAFGGRVTGAPRLMHGKNSEIFHNKKGVFKGLKNPLTATRYHSLILDSDRLPSCLEITAWTDWGEIMGVRHKEYSLEGVQFHPEAILTEHGHDILENFLVSGDERRNEVEGGFKREGSPGGKRNRIATSTF